MAHFLRSLRPAINLLAISQNGGRSNLFKVAHRTLFTDGFLKIPDFLESRRKIEDQFGQMREKFFERMQGYIQDDTGDKMVFSEDLKNVTYLARDTDEDLELLKKMIQRFNSQNKELRFGSFVFGPIVCRLLHHYRKSDLALELLKDEKNRGFFDQLISYLIVADLLYKENRFADVLGLWEHFNDNATFEQKFPRDFVLLTLAACYRLDTPESYQLAQKIVKNARAAGSPLTRRAVLFYSALSLRQNVPETAAESLSMSFNAFTPGANGRPGGRRALPPGDTRLIPVIGKINLMTLSLAKMDRIDDALIQLRSAVQNDRPFVEGCILPETLTTLGERVRATQRKELIAEFENTERAIRENNLVLNAKELNQVLEEPIEGYTKQAPNDIARLRGQSQLQPSLPQRYLKPRQDRFRAVAGGYRQGLTDRDE